MAGVLFFTQFDGGVTERTTTGIGTTGFRHRRFEYRFDLATRIARVRGDGCVRSEEHTSELQSLMRISYAVFCLKKKKHTLTSTMQNNTKLVTSVHLQKVRY